MKKFFISILLVTLILPVFTGCAEKLSEEEMTVLQKQIEDFKKPLTDEFWPNVVYFASVDELVIFINHADLDRTVFKLLYEENAVFVPDAPESWGEFREVAIQSNGLISFEFTKKIIPEITPTPDATPLATLRPGTTKGPIEIYSYFNFYTVEAEKNNIDRFKNSDRYSKIKMENDITGYVESGDVTWLHKDKYIFNIWSNNENIPEDAEKITYKKVSLKFGG